MAAASALAGRGRRSGRSGIAADQALLPKDRARVHPFAGNDGSWRPERTLAQILTFFALCRSQSRWAVQ
jgi:hypothetical protein